MHAFQGRTVDNVIAAMEANHPHLTTQKSLYVEISRARDRAELVTDDAGRLRERLELTTGERISALEAVESAKREAPETAPKAPHGTEREMPERVREPERQPEAKRSAPVSMPVEGGDDAGGARDRKREEPVREKGIEFELELEL